MPDATTLLNFRHLLDTHDQCIGGDRGQQADAHRGRDRNERGGHHQAAELQHGQEQQVPADAGYTGVEMRVEIVALGRMIDRRIAASAA